MSHIWKILTQSWLHRIKFAKINKIMSSNKNGLNGLDVEQIALEKSIFVGVQCPNTIPAIKTDINGKSLPHVEISSSGGS